MSQDLLMAHRQSNHQTTSEAEPIVVDTDDPETVVLELDDGQRLELDRAELRACLDAHLRAA